MGPHCHLLNPGATGVQNKYLDANNLPVSQGSKASRLRPPERYSGYKFPAETTPLPDNENKFIKYVGYFHDGTLTNLMQSGQSVTFSMISAEINEADRSTGTVLSADFRLKGDLHIVGATDIKINNKVATAPLSMESEIAEIYNIEISNHSLEIVLKWETYKPRFNVVKYATITMAFTGLEWKN